jgi:RNA polymerase primary sigma factor
MPRSSPYFYRRISDEALSAYLRKIVAIPVLSKAEELKLGARIQRGDEEALRRLVEANLRFVVKVALRYQGCGLSLLDLINEGNLGLLEAARRYRPKHNVRFITYAVWWIRQAIVQALAMSGGAMRLPLRQIRRSTQIRRKRAEMEQERGREVSDAEFAEFLDIPLERLEDAMRGPVQGDSLDQESGDPDRRPKELVDTEGLSSAELELIAKSRREQIEELLDQLPPREAHVIRLRFGLGPEGPMTLAQIGQHLQLSRERVRQIEARAQAQLRRMALGRHLQDYLN